MASSSTPPAAETASASASAAASSPVAPPPPPPPAADNEAPVSAPPRPPNDAATADDDQAGEGDDAQAAGAAATDADDAATPLTPKEQAALDGAEALKAEGNALYAKQDHQAALDKYLAAADLAPLNRPAHTSSPRSVYFANAAACACAQQDWPRAVDLATRALELRPDYVKALMRRSAAREALDDPEGALADARRVGELAAAGLGGSGAGAAAAGTAGTAPPRTTPVPDRAALQWARSAVARLEPLALDRQEKMKAEVLGKLKDLGNSILGRFGMSLDDFRAEKDPATGSYSIKFGKGGGGGEEEGAQE